MLKATEVKYQNKLKQDKINVQQTIIQYTSRQKLLLFLAVIFAMAFIVVLIVLYRKLDKRRETLHLLNQKLDESNKTKAKLFAIISHDFRSPVNHVYQLLKLQRSKDIVIAPDEKAALEKQTQTATANLLESMEELLIWSKTQMQSFNVTNETADVYNICRQCLDLLNPLIQDKQLQISLDIQPGYYLETDHNFLLAILRNLLLNAIKASPERGQIIIRYATDHKKHYRIRILNQGQAFTQEDYLEALLHTSNLLKGGLGLLIVDELSKKIGADILFGRNDAFTYCDIIFETSKGSREIL
jgi:signal transduction histidine kinase